MVGVARGGRRGHAQVGHETKSWGKGATAASPTRCPTNGEATRGGETWGGCAQSGQGVEGPKVTSVW